MCDGLGGVISEFRRERLALLRRIAELECRLAEKNAAWDGIDRRDDWNGLVCRYCGLPLSGKRVGG